MIGLDLGPGSTFDLVIIGQGGATCPMPEQRQSAFRRREPIGVADLSDLRPTAFAPDGLETAKPFEKAVFAQSPESPHHCIP